MCYHEVMRKLLLLNLGLKVQIAIGEASHAPVIGCGMGAVFYAPSGVWQLSRNIDAFDQWCLRRILRISWRDRISKERGRDRHQTRTDHATSTCTRLSGNKWRTDALANSIWMRAYPAVLPSIDCSWSGNARIPPSSERDRQMGRAQHRARQ